MQRVPFLPNEMMTDAADRTVDRSTDSMQSSPPASARPRYILRSLNDWPTVVVLDKPDPADFD